MRRSGLLMQTEIPDPENQHKRQVLSQFVHLSIQEFLAMAGLLTQSLEQVRDIVGQLAKSEQFNMALLFLYGMAFNENETIKKISAEVCGSQVQKNDIKEVLLELVVVSSFKLPEKHWKTIFSSCNLILYYS